MNDQQQATAIGDAWDVLYDSLPARWHIGMPRYDAGSATWSVTAWGPGVAGGVPSQSRTGSAESEAAALRDLDRRLRAVPRPNRARMDPHRHQLRMADVDGAEASSWERGDRGLTSNELARILRRHAG